MFLFEIHISYQSGMVNGLDRVHGIASTTLNHQYCYNGEPHLTDDVGACSIDLAPIRKRWKEEYFFDFRAPSVYNLDKSKRPHGKPRGRS